MTGPSLSVGRTVIGEMVRLAALEVPGVVRVGRGGSALRQLFSGSPIGVRVRDGRVSVKVWIVARPGIPLEPLARQVRGAVGGAVERLLGLELGSVTILVDGVGS